MEPTEKTLKEIESGKYRDYYIIYNRKSTDDTDNQQNSIAYQKSENVRLSLKKKLSIAPLVLKGFCVNGMVTEKHTAFKNGSEMIFTKNGSIQFAIVRPKFQQLVYFLSKGYFKGMLVLSWDRASRNGRDEMVIKELMDSGVDFHFANAVYQKSSAGELHKDIDGMFAKHRSRDSSEKVTYTFKNLREKGVVTHRAPVGYLNLGDMYKKPFDPERAPIIKEMFNLANSGTWSLSDLARWSVKQGLTMPPMRRRRTSEEKAAEEDDEDTVVIEKVCRTLDPGDVERILKNPFYYGMTKGNDGQMVKSVSHEALISKELFDNVQKIRYGRRSNYQNNKTALCYRSTFICSECRRVYTPYFQKGYSYLGVHCPANCSNTKKNLSFTAMEEKVGELLNRLQFSDGELSELDGKTQDDINIIESKRNTLLDQSERRKRKVRDDLSYLRENRITLLKAGVYTAEAYVEEERRLSSELAVIQKEEQEVDATAHEVIVEIIKLSELLKDAYLHYFYGNSEEKERIIHVMFSELSYDGKELTYQCKNGFSSLQSRFLQLGDLTENRTPITGMRSLCPNR